VAKNLFYERQFRALGPRKQAIATLRLFRRRPRTAEYGNRMKLEPLPMNLKAGRAGRFLSGFSSP